MTVLAFLTDPEVVGKILKALGLPGTAPTLSPSRWSGREMGFALAENEAAAADAGGLGDEGEGSAQRSSPIRPPP